jgi:Ion channel
MFLLASCTFLQLVPWVPFFSNDRSNNLARSVIMIGSFQIAFCIILTLVQKSVLAAVGFMLNTVLLINVTFALIYYDYGTPSDFNRPLSHLDAIYFTVGTFTTAGTGNVIAISERARFVQTLQMIFDFILVVFIIVIVLSRLTSSWQLRVEHNDTTPDHIDSEGQGNTTALSNPARAKRTSGARASSPTPRNPGR